MKTTFHDSREDAIRETLFLLRGGAVKKPRAATQSNESKRILVTTPRKSEPRNRWTDINPSRDRPDIDKGR